MNLSQNIFHYYKNKVFPKISHLRGSTKLENMLCDLALRNIEKISESDVSPIYEREWDNLIILDACRYDVYKEVTGRVIESRVTVGSRTPEFIDKTFSDSSWEDTILITSNPFYLNSLPGERDGFFELTGKKIESTFKRVFNLIMTEWDKENNVVIPEKMCEKAKEVEKKWSESPKIIHFMQPHTPHIPVEYKSKGSVKQVIDKETSKNTVWDKVKRREIKEEKAIEGYKENLSYVMRYVTELSEKLSGKTVITSDHGEFLGEGGFYGHDVYGIDSKVVRKVPWDVVK